MRNEGHEHKSSDVIISDIRVDVAVMKEKIIAMDSRDESISNDIVEAIAHFKKFADKIQERVSTLEKWKASQLSFWAGVMAVIGLIFTALAFIIPSAFHWLRAKMGF